MPHASRAPRAKRGHDFASLACALSTCAVLAGCGGPVGDGDAGRGDAARDADDSARVSVVLSFDPEGLEDDTTVERLSLGVLEVRAPNDRGDLVTEVAMNVELSTSPAEVMLASVAPAVYAGVEVDLGSGAWGSAFVLRLREAERTIEVTLAGPLTLLGRCDAPIALEPGRELALRVVLDTTEVAHLLSEATLPAPIEGVIRIDASSAPALVEQVSMELRELLLECDEHEADR